jgi:hypothetical protein
VSAANIYPVWLPSSAPRAPSARARSHRTLGHSCDKMVFVQKFMMRKKSDTGARCRHTISE